MFNGDLVTLCSLELDDLDYLMNYWNNIELRRDLGPVIPHSRKEREQWIKNTWDEKSSGKAYVFAIKHIKTNEFLGTCSLKNVRPINRSAEVNIAIYDQNNRGKGYGTDAMKVLLEVGFNYLNLHRIGLNVFETNSQAIAVYEKVGFKKVGLRRDTDFVEGCYVNDVAMDILEDEWRELNNI